MDKKLKLFGVNFDNISFIEAIDRISGLIDNRIKTVAFTPNVDHIIRISRNSEFRNIYESADLILNDSRVLYIASRFMRKKLRAKISGSDILPSLCEISSVKGYRIFFLGGRNNSSYIAAEKFKKTYKSINITGIISPQLGFEKNSDENNRILNIINIKEPDILFVGLGTPKQEKWLIENKDKLNATFMIGIGASFEFASGMIKRSPKWMQFLALEWFYRFMKEPKRLWRRYLIGNTLFIMLFVKEFFRINFRIKWNR